jgi:hypothetical protein
LSSDLKAPPGVAVCEYSSRCRCRTSPDVERPPVVLPHVVQCLAVAGELLLRAASVAHLARVEVTEKAALIDLVLAQQWLTSEATRSNTHETDNVGRLGIVDEG